MVALDLSSRQGVLLVAMALAMATMACYLLRQRTVEPAGWAAAAAGAAASARAVSIDRFHQAPCPPPHRQQDLARRNLLLAAVGDSWSPAKWGFSEEASWDLVAIYFGNQTDWTCHECTLALHMPDSMKWQMVWQLMTDKEKKWKGIWRKLRDNYDYVMVADDDLIMDACTLDIFFSTMRRHGLLVAQPSNCRGDDSDNPYWNHWQLPGLELHYVNVIEVTAPGLDMRFLDTKIRPLLKNTYSGWGLPFCFMAAAGFPRSRLAAVDAACMVHPAREAVGEKMSVSERIRRGLIKPGSIYARFAELTPFASPHDEQVAVLEQCGFTPDEAARARQGYPPLPVIHGTVLAEPQPGAQGSIAAAVQQPATRRRLMAAQGTAAARGPLPDVMLQGLQLLAAAAVGAAVAVQWARRQAPAAACQHPLGPAQQRQQQQQEQQREGLADDDEKLA